MRKLAGVLELSSSSHSTPSLVHRDQAGFVTPNIFRGCGVWRAVTTTALDVQRVREPDDAQLITQTLAGDGGAADQLVRRYLADVYAIALRVLSDVDLAQDATQETFVNALRALRSFRGDSSFRTWLLRIALNCARTGARRRSRRREIALDASHETLASEDDAAAVVVERAEAERILRLLDRLPEKQRLAVSLRVRQGLSYQEIGRVLDCTAGAARVNYHLGMKRLKELVQ